MRLQKYKIIFVFLPFLKIEIQEAYGYSSYPYRIFYHSIPYHLDIQ